MEGEVATAACAVRMGRRDNTPELRELAEKSPGGSARYGAIPAATTTLERIPGRGPPPGHGQWAWRTWFRQPAAPMLAAIRRGEDT